MNKTKNILIIILSAAIIGLGLWVTYLMLGAQQKQDRLDSNVSDFISCVAAGNPIQETDPMQCKAKDGKTYIELQRSIDADDICLLTREFTSEKGVTVKINNWKTNMTIGSPVTITGEIPGNWSFEASFPVVLVNWDGLIIAEQPATLQGEWMTEDYVPFTVTLSFDAPTSNKTGTLILRKDNPSGLPENDDAIEIPVTYE